MLNYFYFNRTVQHGLWALCIVMGLLGTRSDATAHDLAIDQLVLWPDTARGSLRGEVTFDPELTRSKDAVPGPEHEPSVLALLKDNLRYEVDGRALHVDYQIRELWVRGGATGGDLVVFSTKLPRGARELRVFAGPAFKALVVSVLVPTPEHPSEASSWLVSRGEWTPSYRLAAPPREAGWRSGGAEQFTPPEGSDPGTPPQAAAPMANEPSPPLPPTGAAETGAPASASGLGWRFIALGFEHILPDGVDHMLFVAGLVLGAARRTRHVLISLTLFTLAHTVTLGLGNVSGLHFPSRLVEPLIALSIALVGIDNLRQVRSAQPLPRWRYAVVFAFGLVHGMGFANALTELSIDRRQLLLALFSFNLGVELGQLAVVALLSLALYGVPDKYLAKYVIVPGSALIFVIGILFAAQRLFLSG